MARGLVRAIRIQQRLELYAMATILSLILAIGQCLCSVFFPVSHRATLQTVTPDSPEPLSPHSWSSSEEELLGGVPSTWAQRRRRWRKRRLSDPDRVSALPFHMPVGATLTLSDALHTEKNTLK